MKIHRDLWGLFPDVLIVAEPDLVQKHEAYKAAKSGDGMAAAALVSEFLDEAAIDRVRQLTGNVPLTLVSAHAEEEMGRNAIPQAAAAWLARQMGLAVDDGIVQINIVNHTKASGFARLARPALFDGQVTAGTTYLMVDDFIGQGGTLANLRGFLMSHGGHVIGAVALTGKPHSAKLQLSNERLFALREKHERLEPWWQNRFGYGFDRLTESEARYLAETPDAQRIRDRITEAEQG
ncbi:MAG: phosphoribosyltransferase [Pseudomonadota bacterium]